MNAPIDIRSTTNMTSKGQVLIPKDVRDVIGLVPGQPVCVGINDQGQAVVLPRPSSTAETPEEKLRRIDAAIEAASARHRTGRSTEAIMAELRGDDSLP
jgi:AbrB family looped-hinge helix DNA binding protein